MPLNDRLACRDNNLNLIRVVAAVAVLVSHAWPITLGPGTDEPLEQALGHSLGHIAVLVFFAASGYLIAASFAGRRSLAAFLLARAARLLPGLAVSVALVALLLGPAVTTLPSATYLASPETWAFVLRNITLLKVQFTLPGVFEANPYPSVEGSIWTLLYEVACYLGVVFLGLAGLLERRTAGTVALVLWLAITVLHDAIGLKTFHQLDQLMPLSQPFALGILAWFWRHRLPVGVLPVLAAAALTALARGTPAYEALLVLTVAWATLALAVARSGPLRRYNRIGDYSYGLYIYAFPLQGLVVWLCGPMTPLENIALSLPLALACAVPSWHLAERPALRAARGHAAAIRAKAGTPA
jgi:peptidoglycan/LPS O-acetylase OafA/YrhL